MKPYLKWVKEETQQQSIRKLRTPMTPHDDRIDALSYMMNSTKKANPRTRFFRMGFMFRWGSAWVGAHWSGFNKRLCVNLIPFCTVWFVWPGGICPIKSQK